MRYFLEGGDRVWEPGRIGEREGIRRRERKGREMEVLTGWEMKEIEGKYATILNISQSKKGEGEKARQKKRREPEMQDTGDG